MVYITPTAGLLPLTCSGQITVPDSEEKKMRSVHQVFLVQWKSKSVLCNWYRIFHVRS